MAQRAIYHENKHEDHGCTSDDTIVIVSSCAPSITVPFQHLRSREKFDVEKCFLRGLPFAMTRLVVGTLGYRIII